MGLSVMLRVWYNKLSDFSIRGGIEFSKALGIYLHKGEACPDRVIGGKQADCSSRRELVAEFMKAARLQQRCLEKEKVVGGSDEPAL